MELNILGFKVNIGRSESVDEVAKTSQIENVSSDDTPIIVESSSIIDNTDMRFGEIESIAEEINYSSMQDIRKLLESSDVDMRSLMDKLRMDFSPNETFKENEELSRDPIVGSAMELITDDATLRNPITSKVVMIDSENKQLAEFLNEFLIKNVKMETRIWEWAFEIVKHGDFKLRRRLHSTDDGQENVFYENVTEPYKISRVEYMGGILGYLDEEEGEAISLQPPGSFVHFMNTKLPKRKKIKVRMSKRVKEESDTVIGGKGDRDEKVSGKEGINTLRTARTIDEKEKQELICYKAYGTCLVDNARYVFRIVRLLNDMLVMSRVARSTQYNIVKVEVGNAGPGQTQQILMDVRRRVEGSTRLSKGKGMKSDPSPIPVNSNVYIPTREGKGDITIESVNDNVDVKAIVDIEYFKNLLFATLRTPKAFLGFEESLPGSLGNTSLINLDIRYSRSVQKVQNILKSGIIELCNNYLAFRNRDNDIDNFTVVLRDVTLVEDSGMIDALVSRIGILDSISALSDGNTDYIDKAKLMSYVMRIIGMDISRFGTKALIDALDSLEGKYDLSSTTPTKEKTPLKKQTKSIEKNMGEEEF